MDPNYPDPVQPDKFIVQALFYPEGYGGPAILLPRTNDGKSTLDVSLDTISENHVAAIVYPANSQYPSIVYSQSSDLKPQVMDSEYFELTDPQNDIVVTPGKLTHPDARFIISTTEFFLEYQTGKDGPLVVYPYGISDTEDLPALVFPERKFYPFIITMRSASGDVLPVPVDYTDDQLAALTPNMVSSHNGKFIQYIDLIFENGVDDNSILSQINPDIPIRIFPNGPDSTPISYPAGLSFSRTITHSSVDVANNNNDGVTSEK